MTFINRQAVAITTDGSGNATTYSNPVQGVVWSITYVPGASPLDTGADIVITEEDTGKAVLTITNIGTSIVEKYPRAAVVDTAGAALSPAAYDLIPAFGRVKFVVSSGAATKSGTFYLNMV